MSRAQVISLTAMVVLAGLIAVLALRNRQAPIVPQDRIHAENPTLEACVTCHGSEGDAPRSTNHPLGNECMRCHGTR